MNTTAPPQTERPSSADVEAGGQALRWGLIAAIVGPLLVAVGIFAWSRNETGFFGILGFAVLFGAATLGVRALGDLDPRIVLDTRRGAQGATAIRGWLEGIPPEVRRELVSIGQPVWWVARGVIGAGGFFALFGATSVTVVGSVAGAAVSIWIGRQTQQDRRWLWYVVPLNVVAAIAVPVFLAAAYAGTSFAFFAPSPTHDRGSNYTPPQPGLMVNGNQITNIYPFDAQGRQVAVRLYDQDGNPISVEPQDCASNRRVTTSNQFPQPVVSTDANGNCKDTTKAPFVPPTR